MAFEGLTERLQNAISKLKRKGKISESDVKEVMRGSQACTVGSRR